MALFTGWATKITAFLTQNVSASAVILSKSDGSPDLQQSDGLGGAKVSLSTASTAALASQATLAALLARLDLPTAHVIITPSDTADVTAIASKGLMIGGAGNIYYCLVAAPTTPVGPIPVVAGQILLGQFAKVRATTTTATTIVGMS